MSEQLTAFCGYIVAAATGVLILTLGWDLIRHLVVDVDR